MHDEEHPHGLAHDLKALVTQTSRRQLLRMLGGASLIPLIACGGGDDGDFTPDASTGGTGADASTGSGTCTTIPEETAGPFPGDGSNGANALILSGIVRSDIRASVGGATGVAGGVVLTVKIKLVNTAASCAPIAGHAVYLWHCDREGNYSMYSTAVKDENYLRGVQVTDADGVATFTTVFPGCYAGRMPHIHFEVYPDASSITSARNKVATSQLAFPTETCNTVYATSGYEASVRNLSQLSFSSDNVFRDGTAQQMSTVTGSVSAGYVSELLVAIRA